MLKTPSALGFWIILASTALFSVSTPRLSAGGEYQFHELALGDPVPGARETDYHAAYVTLSHQLTPTRGIRVAAGTVAGNVAYRIAARMSRPSRESFLELGYEGGQRPTDSMALEVLGAEERRATLKGRFEVPGNRRIRVSGEVFLREIEIGSRRVSDLGEGWGARWEAEYLFYQFRRSMVSVAYVGAVDDFSCSDSARVAGAAGPALSTVEDDLHRHGIVVRGRRPVADELVVHAELGVDYRFDDEEITYSAAGGQEWWISEFTRLTADAANYTSGLAGNAGSGYLEGRVGVSSTF